MNRKSIFFTAGILVFSLFIALNFEGFHKGHEVICNEENCPICLTLEIIKNTNKFVCNANNASVEFLSFFYNTIAIPSALLLVPATLVMQKVKLII